MRTLTAVILSTAALTSTAHAASGVGAELILGLTGEAEADELSCKSGCTGSQALSDEDLEQNFGVAATYERAVRPNVRVGARASYLMGQGDDTDQDLGSFTLGAWGRYLVPVGRATLHVGADLGPSYVTSEAMVLGTSMDFSGVGFHAVIGGGVSAPIADGIEFRGGLYYSYEQTGSLEADENVQGTAVELEIEDAVATRVLVSAGLAF